MGLNFGRKFIRQRLSDIKKCAKYSVYKQSLPKNPMHDDIYIVEFPKSGVSWLSFILANIELQLEGINEDVTFYNVHRYVIDIHQLRNAYIRRYLNRTFIKSHSEYNPYYFFVIYLIRNPIDVMVSYYNFMLSFGYSRNFECFIKDKRYGIGAWKAHVNSWWYKRNDAQRIHFIKYEDLLSDTKLAINNLYTNLGCSLNDSILQRAIEKSNFENMMRSENHYRKFNKNYNLSFVGKVGKLKKEEIITDEVKSWIYKQVEEEIFLLRKNADADVLGQSR